MTNREYEAACVKAVTGQRKLAAVDNKISEVEHLLDTLNENRREIINQYDLNREPETTACAHVPDQYEDGVDFCIDCGVRL